MKTKKEWESSKKCLDEFLQVGDVVDDEIYDYFLCVLPPACNSARCLQLGEPSTHNSDGRACFETLKKDGQNWIYAGVLPVPNGEIDRYVY